MVDARERQSSRVNKIENVLYLVYGLALCRRIAYRFFVFDRFFYWRFLRVRRILSFRRAGGVNELVGHKPPSYEVEAICHAAISLDHFYFQFVGAGACRARGNLRRAQMKSTLPGLHRLR